MYLVYYCIALQSISQNLWLAVRRLTALCTESWCAILLFYIYFYILNKERVRNNIMQHCASRFPKYSSAQRQIKIKLKRYIINLNNIIQMIVLANNVFRLLTFIQYIFN